MQRDRETKAVKVKKMQASYLDATGFRDTTPKLWKTIEITY